MKIKALIFIMVITLNDSITFAGIKVKNKKFNVNLKYKYKGQ